MSSQKTEPYMLYRAFMLVALIAVATHLHAQQAEAKHTDFRDTMSDVPLPKGFGKSLFDEAATPAADVNGECDEDGEAGAECNYHEGMLADQAAAKLRGTIAPHTGPKAKRARSGGPKLRGTLK